MVFMEFKADSGGFVTVRLDTIESIKGTGSGAMVITREEVIDLDEAYADVIRRVRDACNSHPEMWLYEKKTG